MHLYFILFFSSSKSSILAVRCPPSNANKLPLSLLSLSYRHSLSISLFTKPQLLTVSLSIFSLLSTFVLYNFAITRKRNEDEMEAPEFYQNSFCAQFVPEKRYSTDNKTAGADIFIVEDLLDFPNEDDAVITDGALDTVTGNSTDSSTVTVVDSCNSSSFSGCEPNFIGDIGCRSLADGHFSSDLYVPVYTRTCIF